GPRRPRPLLPVSSASARGPRSHVLRVVRRLAGWPEAGSDRRRSARGRPPGDVAEGAVALGELPGASARGAVATAARGAQDELLALLREIWLGVVDALAVESPVAGAAGAPAGKAGRGVGRALGHEAHHDRRGRLVLDADLLAEPAAKPAGAA